MTPAEQFTVVFRRHHRDIERFVQRRAPDLAISDVVAEVFLVAWRRFDQVPRRDPLPWLYATARNVLANEVRGAQRVRRLTERIAQDTGASVDADHGEYVTDRLALAAAFDRLAESDQEVLRLVAWERLSSRAAARVLGCGVTAFAMRLNRARARLRAELTMSPASRTTIDALLAGVDTSGGPR